MECHKSFDRCSVGIGFSLAPKDVKFLLQGSLKWDPFWRDQDHQKMGPILERSNLMLKCMVILGDFSNNIRIPINQPGFNGRSTGFGFTLLYVKCVEFYPFTGTEPTKVGFTRPYADR